MSANYIDAGMLKRMFVSGAYNLENNKEWINKLNVFPVPDGDTGTNMSLTLFSAVNELNSLSELNMQGLAKAISYGSLRGARGNSGVITSQLLRGFSKEISALSEIDNECFANALERAVETAYRAVMKPKEGTILTVAKGMADKARELSANEMRTEDFLFGILEEAKAVLEITPDLLAVLKEAGVVDAGGQGLVLFFEGMYLAFVGRDVATSNGAEGWHGVPKKAAEDEAKEARWGAAAAEKEIKFGYCTEFIINLNKTLSKKEVDSLSEFLDSIGDSIVLVPDDDLVKIHVHTNEPGTVLQRALKHGELSRIKIDNMREEHREVLGLSGENAPEENYNSSEMKDYGFISVCTGAGFKSIFMDMGADVVINGGQTMNPSTEDFLRAIGEVNAENIYVFPNNKNIIMAAQQAADLTNGKNVIVIPTKTVTQGIAAMINFDSDASAEDNEKVMKECISTVHTSQVTYAVRDTRIDDFDIKNGDIMAVGDSKILSVGKDISEVAMSSVDKLVGECSELISVYYGEGFSEEDAERLSLKLEEKYPDCSVELVEGGQPVYYCIISVE